MIDFFEGKMDKGYPAGFVRYMTEERNDMFFGQLNKDFISSCNVLYFTNYNDWWGNTRTRRRYYGSLVY